MLLASVFTLLCLSAWSYAFLLPQSKWNGLKVTWAAFSSLPRQESEAKELGWAKTAECDNQSKFRGKRYVQDNDNSVILLFDVNGYIAGIQCGLAKTTLTSDYPPTRQLSVFQSDGDHLTLTAYFTDPDKICTTGRTSAEWQDEGTGNVLYIQNGTDPVSHSIHIPELESSLAATAWKRGHCFPSMGVHYWYNITATMSCDDFFPVFLLYNDGLLTAFGWATGVGQTSKRFEHPQHAVFSAFLDPVPLCLNGYAQLSTMHIYMTSNPAADLC